VQVNEINERIHRLGIGVKRQQVIAGCALRRNVVRSGAADVMVGAYEVDEIADSIASPDPPIDSLSLATNSVRRARLREERRQAC